METLLTTLRMKEEEKASRLGGFKPQYVNLNSSALPIGQQLMSLIGMLH